MPVLKRRRLYLWQLIVVVLLPLLITSPALAVDYVWNGAGDGTSWTQATNWNPATSAPGVGPTVGDTVQFNAAVNIALGGASTVDAVIINSASAQFSNGILTTATMSITTPGPTITMATNGLTIDVTGGLNTNGNDFTFNGPGSLYVRGANTLTGGGTVTLGNAAYFIINSSQTLNMPVGVVHGAGTFISLLTGATLTINIPAGSSSYAGVIVGSGSLVKTGAGELALSAGNTYNGTTTVNAGTLTAAVAPGVLPITTNLEVAAGGNASVLNQTINAISGAGSIFIQGNSSFISQSTVNRTYSGNMTRGVPGATFRHDGPGTLTLTGSIQPLVDVFNGTLVFNGTCAGSITTNGGDLMGTGTVNQLLTIQNGALRPGNSIGTFNAALGLDLVAGSTLDIEVSGGAADQVNVTGTVNLAAGAIAIAGTPTIGSVFTIIANDGADAVAGTFGALPEGTTIISGSGHQFVISYVGGSGNDVTLTALTGTPPGGGGGGTPEPEPDPNTLPAPSVTQGSGPSPIGSLDGSQLSWPQVKGADHYRIYRADCPNCKRKQVGWVKENSFVDASAIAGQPYYYWLRTENGDGMGPYSNWMTAWRYEQNPGRAGDFNGDGIMDLLWWNPDNNQLSIWFMSNGQVASVSAPGEALDINEWLLIATADFNGDGAWDFLWWKPETGEALVWYLDKAKATAGGAGEWLIKSSGVLETMTGNSVIAYPGDLSGDGKADILWRDHASGQITLWIMGDDGMPQLNGPPTPADDSITRGERPGITGTLNWQVAGLANVSGDGKLEVMWKNMTNNRLATWSMDGSNINAVTQENKGLDLVWRSVGLGDLNGDSQADIVWRNEASGAVQAWLMQGGVFNEERSMLEGSAEAANWQVKAVGDFCQAGRDDVYCKHSESSAARIVTLDNGEHTPAVE